MEHQKNEEKLYEDDLYKKFFRAKGKGGLLSLRPWWDGGKIAIDIGELGADGKLQSNTKVWCSILNLGLYLKAVYDGRAMQLYPKSERNGIASDEGFVYYGGANTPEGPVSRILKIHYWERGEGQFDSEAFAWKTGIFVGRQSSTGAFIPDMSKPKSHNLIKVSRLEMAEMYYRMDIATRTFAAEDPDWITKLNGKRPKE